MTAQVPWEQVVETIAKKEGVSPAVLSPPLYSVIDPEALDAVVQGTSDSTPEAVEVEFSYLEYVVRVECDPDLQISVEKKNTSQDGSMSFYG